MPWITNDFACEDCNHEFEELWNKVYGDDSEKPWQGIVSCPECSSENLKRLVSSSGVAAFSIMDREAQMQALKKRSTDHSVKLMKKNRDEIQSQFNKKPKAVG
jgi:putative FmdB family regulatory protein